MPLLLETHTKKPWYVTWACDTEVTNTNYHYPAGSCRGWAGRASHQRLLLFSAVFATCGRPQFYYFPPLLPFLGGCSFILFGRFCHLPAAAFLCFSAFFSIFTKAQFYFLGRFVRFWAVAFLVSSAFLLFPGGCIFVIFSHVGYFNSGAFSLCSAV